MKAKRANLPALAAALTIAFGAAAYAGHIETNHTLIIDGNLVVLSNLSVHAETVLDSNLVVRGTLVLDDGGSLQLLGPGGEPIDLGTLFGAGGTNVLPVFVGPATEPGHAVSLAALQNFNPFPELRQDPTTLAVAENFGATATGIESHAEGAGTATGFRAHAESGGTATGRFSHAEGRSTLSGGIGSHSEGRLSVASGNSSHAEGWSTVASGTSAHAEGTSTVASGPAAHAEGVGTTASGDGAHAEGMGTIASANLAHAEGWETVASGGVSHAQGGQTIAGAEFSHAGGRFAQTLPEHTNALIHATGLSTNDMKTTVAADTAHFDKLYTFESWGENPPSNAVLSLGEIEARGVGDLEEDTLQSVVDRGNLATRGSAGVSLAGFNSPVEAADGPIVARLAAYSSVAGHFVNGQTDVTLASPLAALHAYDGTGRGVTMLDGDFGVNAMSSSVNADDGYFVLGDEGQSIANGTTNIVSGGIVVGTQAEFESYIGTLSGSEQDTLQSVVDRGNLATRGSAGVSLAGFSSPVEAADGPIVARLAAYSSVAGHFVNGQTDVTLASPLAALHAYDGTGRGVTMLDNDFGVKAIDSAINADNGYYVLGDEGQDIANGPTNIVSGGIVVAAQAEFEDYLAAVGGVGDVRLDRSQTYEPQTTQTFAAAEFTVGIHFVQPVGDLSMGTFTNQP